MVVHLLPMQGQKDLGFHKKYLNLCSFSFLLKLFKCNDAPRMSAKNLLLNKKINHLHLANLNFCVKYSFNTVLALF